MSTLEPAPAPPPTDEAKIDNSAPDELKVGSRVWVQVYGQRTFVDPVRIEKIYEHDGKLWYYVKYSTSGLTADQLTLADETQEVIEPCRSEAERFLSALDPQGKQFTFQTFSKEKTLATILHGSLGECWQELSHLCLCGAVISVTVNETDFKGRSAENVVRVRALFIDLDGAPLDPVVTCSTPPHIVVESSPGRWHCYWRVSDVPLDQFKGLQKTLIARFNSDKSVHDLPPVMRLPGFIHRKKEPFLTVLQDFDETRAPYTFEQMLEAFPPVLETVPEPDPPSPPSCSSGSTDQRRGEAWAQAALAASAAELATTGEGERHATLLKKANRMGTMVARGWIGAEEVRRALYAAAQANGQVKEDGLGHFNKTVKDGISHGLLTPHDDLPDDDNNNGTSNTAQTKFTTTPAAAPVASIKKRSKHNGADPRPPNFSDEALALQFAERHAATLRYVAAWSRWFDFNGTRWAADATLLTFDRSRKICRAAAAACNKAKVAVTLASAKTVAAVERLSRADRRLAATIDQWDADPWLLNTPGGVVDLRTGQVRPHRADDYFTKITAIAPNPGCPISLWTAVIDRATGGDKALAGYLQRLFGYGLTGSTQEQSLHFAYGTGANGKGTIIGTVASTMGDYHTSAPIETFTASAVDRHTTDLADLRGARLVSAVETEEGRRWAEARIKALTGGDRIKARHMRQDNFEYVPQFTLIIQGNHKPGLRSVDEAIRRRFHLIPFTVTIPKAERDPQLSEKLQAEWPGILAWCIEGCLAWQHQGLDPPACVRDATAVYLEAQDALSAWIEECCTWDYKSFETTNALFASWTRWANNAGEYVGSRRSFAERLENRGIHPHRINVARGFTGLRLIT